MRRLLNFLPGRRGRMEQSPQRGVAYHLDRRVDDLVRSGLASDEALRQARIEFGGFAQVQEEVRETWVCSPRSGCTG
jgi:hypothetical protein